MSTPSARNFSETARLARALSQRDIFDWLSTTGYFPEPYVLPPCYTVTKHPPFGTIYFPYKPNRFSPLITEYLDVHFPKTELTDRTFGVVHPKIHSDISTHIARNWKTILKCIFHPKNKVYSYSFPIPLDRRNRGQIGRLRSGRLIYQFIEMAEKDLASVAYRYKFLITTDIKNFYPSIYTHSIAWALHGKRRIRARRNRFDFRFVGNRLDKLFQDANDGCTNGVPIGPAVSDVIAEVILGAVDRSLSGQLPNDVLVVRFKDDYRILVKKEENGRLVVKELQAALRKFRLQLNDEKTKFHKLPDGLFRPWVSQYLAANPQPKARYDFRRFREVCLSVIAIDKDNPGSGVIDRFLGDIVTSKNKLRVTVGSRSIPRVISLLLMLGGLRTKAFPKVLAIIETLLKSRVRHVDAAHIEEYLVEFLQDLARREDDNRYLLLWIVYFLRGNGMGTSIASVRKFEDPILKPVRTSRFTLFKDCQDFQVFESVGKSSRRVSLLDHLRVFPPQ